MAYEYESQTVWDESKQIYVAKMVKVDGWLTDLSKQARTSCVKYGLDASVYLPTACADFYVLERLTADGSGRAAVMLKELENKLAREFAMYLDMIVGGEIRHGPYQESDGYDDDENHRSCPKCAGEGAYYEHTSLLGYHDVNEHTWNYECHSNGWNSELVCKHKDCHLHSGCSQTTCNRCGGEGYIRKESRQRDFSSSYRDDRITEFLERVHNPQAPSKTKKSGQRGFAWSEWRLMRKKHGLGLLAAARDDFNNDNLWPGQSYGGRMWGTAASLVYDYLSGTLKARTFVDRCWSLQHNNGCIFNKVYRTIAKVGEYDCTNVLQTVLETQYEDKYDNLAYAYASPDVRALWTTGKYRTWTNHDDVWLGVQQTHDAVEW